MGKPSNTRLSKRKDKKPSNHSLNINPTKIQSEHKAQRRRTNKKIKKLFQQLRSESNTSILSEHNALEENLDSTKENTVIVIDQNENHGVKRKLDECVVSESKRIRNDSTIVINDEDDVLIKNSDQNTDSPAKCMNPIDCSTPIAKPSSSRLLTSENETQEINKDSFLTIDLTTDSELKANCSKNNTVIDLVNTKMDSQDCSIVSVSNASLSVSGESDVTVINMKNKKDKTDKKMQKFVNGIARMNSSEKGRLLELITKNIFNGCKVPAVAKESSTSIRDKTNRATETQEDTYIREVILGQAPSRNSIGSNIYNPEKDIKNKSGLRMVVIDGSNVAMAYNKGKQFSVRALKICIDYFVRRGHIVKAFVPHFRCKAGQSSDPRLLDQLERQGLVVYTPSRDLPGRRICSYDDRYIVQCAAEFDGVIVSLDNYNDLLRENPRWRYVIENRVLPFTWVNDMIMFPKDPLGRNGPSLEAFLRHPNPTNNNNNAFIGPIFL